MDSDAFVDQKQRRAELLLVAASNSGRRSRLDEMSDRYMKALPLWRELYTEQKQNARLWPRYLDAAAGSKKLETIDAEVTLDIYRRHPDYDFLMEDLDFRSRLVDVMIRIEEPEKLLPISRELFENQRHDHEMRLRYANNLHAVSRFADADPHYDHLIDMRAFTDDDQTRGQMMVNSARNNASMGNFHESRRIFEMLWDLGLRNRDYEIEYAVILQKTGDPEKAQEILERKPLNLEQQYRLASMYTSAHELESADGVYERILREQPGELVALRRRSELLLWLKRYAKSEELLLVLLSENPNDKTLLSHLAIAQLRSGRTHDALKLLRDLLKAYPSDRELFIPYLDALANLQVILESDAESVTRIADVHERDQQRAKQNLIAPTQNELAVALGLPLARIGQFDRAIAMLEQAVNEGNADSNALQTLADVLMRAGYFDRAIEYYDSLLVDQPESSYYQMQLAFAHQGAGDYAKARRYFDPIVNDERWLSDDADDHVSFLLAAANNSRQLNRLEESRTRYRFVFDRLLTHRRDPDFRSTYLQPLMDAAEGLPHEEIQESEEFARFVNELYRDRSRVLIDEPAKRRKLLLRLSDLVAKLGQPKRAAKLLEEVIAAYPTEVEPRLKFAKLLRATDELRQAAAEFEKVLDQIKKSDSRYPTPFVTGITLDAADTYVALKELDRAKALGEEALLTIEPSFAANKLTSVNRSQWLLYLRALNLAEVDTPEARRRVLAYYKLDWRSSEHHFLFSQLGEALYRYEYSQEAADVFERLPGHNEARLWRLAEFATNSGRFDEAIAHYQTLLDGGFFGDADPRHLDVQLALANLNRQIGNQDESQRLYKKLAAYFREKVSRADRTEADIDGYLNAMSGLARLEDEDHRWLAKLLQGPMPTDNEQRIKSLSELAALWGEPEVADVFFQELLQTTDDPTLELSFARYLLKHQRTTEAKPIVQKLLANETFAARADIARELQLALARIHMSQDEFELAKPIFDRYGTPFVSESEWALVLSRTGEADRAIQLLESVKEPSEDDLILLASMYAERKDFDSARKIYERFLQEDPNNERAQRWLADLDFWARKYDQAIARYEALLEKSPNDFELLESYGKALLWIGRYDDAVVVLSDLLKRQPQRKELWIPWLDAMAGSDTATLQNKLFVYIDQNHAKEELAPRLAERIARLYLRHDQPRVALHRLKPIVGKVEADHDMMLTYGDTLSALERYDDAILVYEHFFDRLDDREIKPENRKLAEYYLRFGDVLQKGKYYRDARNEYDDVLRAVDDSIPTIYRRALLSSARNYIALKAYDRGLAQFELLHKLDPDSFQFYEEYAGALLSAGRPRKALMWIRKSDELTLNGQYLLAAIHANVKDFHSASNTYRAIIATHPEEWRAYRELAQVSAWGKDFRTAIYVYRQLLQRNPNSEVLQVGLANTYLWSKQYDKALQLYTPVLNRTPKRYDLWPSFVEAASAEGVEASAAARKLLAMIVQRRANWPKDLTFRRAMMESLFRMEMEEDAMRMLQELLRASPRDPALRRRIADELHRQGEYAEAEKHYDVLLSLQKSGRATKSLNVRGRRLKTAE